MEEKAIGIREKAIGETKEARAEDVETKPGPRPKPKMICGAEWEGTRSGVLVGRSGTEPKKKDLCSFEGAKPERKRKRKPGGRRAERRRTRARQRRAETLTFPVTIA